MAREPRLLLGLDPEANWLQRVLGLVSQLVIRLDFINTHKYVIGLAGMGKSKGVLEHQFHSLFSQGIACSLLDPHGASADALLSRLFAEGYFNTPDCYDRLWYIELADDDWYLRMNLLKQDHLTAHETASYILEAFHRAWPNSSMTPSIDTLVLGGCYALVKNERTLPELQRFLTDKDFRDLMLVKVADHNITSYFHDWWDTLKGTEQSVLMGAAVRRIFLLTFSPVLRYSLSSPDNVLQFKRLMDDGVSVIFDLRKIHDADARKLIGCLLVSGYEKAALARDPYKPGLSHHLIIDEFSQFAANSSEALNVILSEARKFRLFVTMAHQTMSQLSDRSNSAVGNAQVKITFRTGREDAEVLAKTFGVVDPNEIKHEVEIPEVAERQHPMFTTMFEQWERWIRKMTELAPRRALVKVGDSPAIEVSMPTVPSHNVLPQDLEPIKQVYRNRLMRHKSSSVFNPEEPKTEGTINFGPIKE